MDSNAAGSSVSSVTLYTLVWSWLLYFVAVAATIPSGILASVRGLPSLVPATIRLYLAGIPSLINRSTTTPRYWFHVASLTVWANVTGRSFIIRRHGRLPRLITRTASKQVRTFHLTIDDIYYIYRETGVHVHAHQGRKWRPADRVG